MRGTTLPASPSRIKGKVQLQRRLNGLLRACIRFSLHRAETDADRRWAAEAVDLMQAAYDRLACTPTDQRTIR
jgi:hypothetical protein